jgi:hypothetical protein
LVRYEKTLSSYIALLHLAAAIICWRKVGIIYGYILKVIPVFSITANHDFLRRHQGRYGETPIALAG